MFVGGEFFDDPKWLADKLTLSIGQSRFLNGGRASLTVIADFLLNHNIRRILLPTYLCPSILDVFQQCGLAWDFYRINENLSIDIADLLRLAEGFGAMYFINYFGFSHAPQTLATLQNLRAAGTLLVEDNAQVGFAERMTGDFTFNSLRKLGPFDGSYLFTNHDIDPFIRRYAHLPNRRLPIIRVYRHNLREYLLNGKGSHRHLIALHARAERFYAEDTVVVGDAREREIIEQQDWPGMRQRRRENYAYLLERIRDIPEISPIFPALPEDASPLGLPVYVKGMPRDALYDYLGENGIGLFIHWEEIQKDPRLECHPIASAMAALMLTLTCDQRTSREQIDFLIRHLIKGIALLKD